MIRKKTVFFLLVALLFSHSALQAAGSLDFSESLSELKLQLNSEVNKLAASRQKLLELHKAQNDGLMEVTKRCNEISLMLYSQTQNCTFEMAYALQLTTSEYEEFTRHRLPFDEMISGLDSEIGRYSRLIESLQKLPTVPDTNFMQDSLQIADRDSCILYANRIMDMYSEARTAIEGSRGLYDSAEKQLKESYEYAKERYKYIQQKVFMQPMQNYAFVLGNLSMYTQAAVEEPSMYSVNPMLSTSYAQFLTYIWLVIAIMACLLVRLPRKEILTGVQMYLPLFTVALLVFAFRILFVPNRLINLIYPPVLVLASIWQSGVCLAKRKKAHRTDRIIAWVSLVVLSASAVAACMGYVMPCVLTVTWWTILLTYMASLMAVRDLVRRYYGSSIEKKAAVFREQNPSHGLKPAPGDCIGITWLYDFITKTIIPSLFILAVPFSIWRVMSVFDMLDFGRSIIYSPFMDLSKPGEEITLQVSAYMVVVSVIIFFLFRYLSYLFKALYRVYRIDSFTRKSGREVIQANDLNLSLANNVIGILVWAVYIILTVNLLHVPMGALAMISTGLAAGLGLAMKDILNNFIYAIQLMSGRLRIGDWIVCDGMRGQVISIGYQCTQIETTDGAIVAFLNADLIGKNFKNLTLNHNYEFVKIVVGVRYGTDVNQVRELLLEALKPLQRKNSLGLDIVDKKKGMTIEFEEFGESSLNVSVKQFVLVQEKVRYTTAAQEIIYNTLNANDIAIPFPQRDVHIIQ